MHRTTHLERDQFAPPQQPARLRAVVLAVLAHVLLIGALTWGVNWKSSTDTPTVEAQLWAAVPQQAAPRASAPPAPTPPPPAPVPPVPAPPAPVKPPPPPPPPPPVRAPTPPAPAPKPPPPPPRQAEPDTR
ncbi:MAG: cell envelope integrity protein TolA, partial [Giesbergeria sp.]|nr:cell envelope integrity protein TolA [Giesbergeria sp.]